MKRIVSVFLALAVSATLVFVVTSWKHSVHAQGVCSVPTLTGNYGFAFSGFQLQSPGPGAAKGSTKSVPFYREGLATFDGAGNFSQAFTFSQNSVPCQSATCALSMEVPATSILVPVGILTALTPSRNDVGDTDTFSETTTTIVGGVHESLFRTGSSPQAYGLYQSQSN